MKPHKHSELIKAWADGAEIEQYLPSSYKWTLAKSPYWDEDTAYRIKPTPKPDYVHFMLLCNDGFGSTVPQKFANVKVTFDGETIELKHVEIL